MSLSKLQVKKLAQEIQPLLVGCFLIDCFQSGLNRYVLSFRQGSQRYRLFLCFEEPFLRFHLMTGAGVASGNRSEDVALAEEIDKALKGRQVQAVDVLNDDRILSLSFTTDTGTYYLIAEFIVKKPNFYLLDSRRCILKSEFPVDNDIYELPTKHDLPEEGFRSGRGGFCSSEVEQYYAEREELQRLKVEKKLYRAFIKRRKKRAERFLTKSIKLQEEYSRWQDVQHEAELLLSNFNSLQRGMTEITVKDWDGDADRVIQIDPKLMPKEVVGRRYHHSKRLRVGLDYVKTNIIKSEELVERCNDLLEKLDSVRSFEELDEFLVGAKFSREQIAQENYAYFDAKQNKKIPGIREYCSDSGLKIYVGKSDIDNERLTFSIARGNDHWFHVADLPGSHVVLRIPKNKDPDREAVLDAAQLALRYSKAWGQEYANIVTTQCKKLSKLRDKGRRGKVVMSHHYTFEYHHNPQRYHKLKQRQRQNVLTLTLSQAHP